MQTLDNNKDSTDNNPSAAIAVALQESTFWQERMARFLESLTSITEKGHLKVDYTKKLEQCRLAPNVAAAAKLLVEVADGYLDLGDLPTDFLQPLTDNILNTSQALWEDFEKKASTSVVDCGELSALQEAFASASVALPHSEQVHKLVENAGLRMRAAQKDKRRSELVASLEAIASSRDGGQQAENEGQELSRLAGSFRASAENYRGHPVDQELKQAIVKAFADIAGRAEASVDSGSFGEIHGSLVAVANLIEGQRGQSLTKRLDVVSTERAACLAYSTFESKHSLDIDKVVRSDKGLQDTHDLERCASTLRLAVTSAAGDAEVKDVPFLATAKGTLQKVDTLVAFVRAKNMAMRKEDFEVSMAALRDISEGVPGGKSWLKDVRDDASFADLQEKAKATIMKVKGKDFVGRRAKLEEDSH